MKRLTTFLIVVALVFKGAISLAQIDDAKMERDLRVASGILSSLMSNNNDHLFGGGEPNANYVEGFGVIFTIEDNMVFKYNYNVQYEVAREAQKEAQVAVREVQRAQREIEKEYREVERERKEKEKDKKKDKDEDDDETYVIAPMSPLPPMPAMPDVEVNVGLDEEEMKALKEKADVANEEFAKSLREAFETFLVDYSHLISQLKPSDKILLTTKSNSSYNFVFSMDSYEDDRKIEKSRLSAELLVKDHKDFQSGKLSREKLVEKIKFVENAEMVRKPDLDLFGNMLKTTYNSKYTETYFLSSIPKYELLAGLGVVYSIKVYSSYSEDDLYRMPGNKTVGLTKEARDKAVEVMYPLFVDSFKENMIRYGSTIKSLGQDEKLIVKVKMTKCETCTFPSVIEFVTNKSVLDQFSKGALTLDQAKNKVNLK